jgi:large subunit ribosomal protein L10
MKSSEGRVNSIIKKPEAFMAKTRKEKESIVSHLNEQLDQAKAAVIVNYKGLTVSDTENLRNELRKNQVSFSIIKNSLLKIAFKEKGIDADKEIMDQPLAIAFGNNDEVTAAHEINNFIKGHEALEILGGIYQKEYVGKDKIITLANLPSREELYAKIVGSLAAPMSGMVNVLSGNLRGLVNVLSQYQDQKVN